MWTELALAIFVGQKCVKPQFWTEFGFDRSVKLGTDSKFCSGGGSVSNLAIRIHKSENEAVSN